jgi:hypothetical protein
VLRSLLASSRPARCGRRRAVPRLAASLLLLSPLLVLPPGPVHAAPPVPKSATGHDATLQNGQLTRALGACVWLACGRRDAVPAERRGQTCPWKQMAWSLCSLLRFAIRANGTEGYTQSLVKPWVWMIGSQAPVNLL